MVSRREIGTWHNYHKGQAAIRTDFYGFSTPVTHTQVLIEINFQAPKTL